MATKPRYYLKMLEASVPWSKCGAETQNTRRNANGTTSLTFSCKQTSGSIFKGWLSWTRRSRWRDACRRNIAISLIESTFAAAQERSCWRSSDYKKSDRQSEVDANTKDITHKPRRRQKTNQRRLSKMNRMINSRKYLKPNRIWIIKRDLKPLTVSILMSWWRWSGFKRQVLIIKTAVTWFNITQIFTWQSTRSTMLIRAISGTQTIIRWWDKWSLRWCYHQASITSRLTYSTVTSKWHASHYNLRISELVIKTHSW